MLKGIHVKAAQALGLCRVHHGVGERHTFTMFPFVPLEVRQILLKGKSLLRPGATTTEQQFGAATDDGIVVKLHVGGSQRVEEELVCPQHLWNWCITWVEHRLCVG